jgi:hypothetical protein
MGNKFVLKRRACVQISRKWILRFALRCSERDAGTEHSPEGICKEPGTRRPIIMQPS